MGSTELCLSLEPVYASKTMSELLREVSLTPEKSQKLLKLNDYLKQLDDELKKIEVFKRELPLSMVLLNEAMVKLKDEVMHCTEDVEEEFISEKSNCEKDGGSEMDMNNWMSSAQLWNDDHDDGDDDDLKKRKPDSPLQMKTRNEESVIGKLCKTRNRGRALVPFKEKSDFAYTNKENSLVPGLSLKLPGDRSPVSELDQCNHKITSKNVGISRIESNSPFLTENGTQQPQTVRKQRRCWSPELHRLFLNALQQLGGPQVATPKQIREMMHVEGLTNDEVKSHLQKYRLHIRKLPPSAAAASYCDWQDQVKGLSMTDSSQTDSPQGPLSIVKSANGVSATRGKYMEGDEDENSEDNSCRSQFHKSGKNVFQVLEE